jgi:hypothetical protein
MLRDSKARSFVITCVGAGIASAGFLLLYLFAAPVFVKGLAALRPRTFGLESARNYYTVLSAAVASVVGAAGITLGYLYYIHRLEWEASRSDRQATRTRIDDVLRRLEEVDDEFSEILFSPLGGEANRRHAHKVIRALTAIEQLLDHSADLNTIEQRVIDAVVRFDSYVESRCRSLLENGSDVAGRDGSQEIFADLDEYADRLNDARRALLRCVER